MLGTLVKKFFGSRNERVIRQLQKKVQAINALEPKISALSDEALRAKTDEFKTRLKQGVTLESILSEAFAVVREASRRTLGLRHFDVQLIGGMVLHGGDIAEMRTGEGKTLVSTLPVYLNALTGKGVHVVTVNDYLAKRDCEWMKPIYDFLGLTLGVIYPDMPHEQKQAAYACDITYGTNNEFGFDYLRDNMVFNLEQRVQRELSYAVVDEVDSILIDEARTPLIISGPAEDSSELYRRIDKLIPSLRKQVEENGEGDFTVDEKHKQVLLTEEGHQHVETLLIEAKLIDEGDSLYHPSHIALMHHVNAALRAHCLYQRDVDYIVKNNEIVIVDEHTGRTLSGRRWSEGLHQAVEAKENVRIQNENQTMASITFQNYFRLYNKLSGMTGTADTEAYELQQIYDLEVIVIPTNRPMVRRDHADMIYKNKAAKYKAILTEVKDCVAKGQPVLLGTASIEVSEYLSTLFEKEKITHEVLNAKQHEREAHIIEHAGRPGTVTIATNMAGRGTDIVLGGNLEAELKALGEAATEDQKEAVKSAWAVRHKQVLDAGGLHIIGSERHESRRIDNQLRGRAGRQGDPGSSRFYLSFEDGLMRIFASERVSRLMETMGMDEDTSITNTMITRVIENAQRRVEGYHFDIRKQLLQYDNVASDQRKVIYEQRTELLSMTDISATIAAIRAAVIENLVDLYVPEDSMVEQWNLPALQQQCQSDFGLTVDLVAALEADPQLSRQDIIDQLQQLADERYAQKELALGASVMRELEKSLMLQTLDSLWRDHLAALDYLRQGIHLRGYAQKDPKQEYKREAFELFKTLLDKLRFEVMSLLFRVELQSNEDLSLWESEQQSKLPENMEYHHADFSAITQEEPELAGEDIKQKPMLRDASKVGRNDPCPCQSGKKYKQCHGQLS